MGVLASRDSRTGRHGGALSCVRTLPRDSSQRSVAVKHLARQWSTRDLEAPHAALRALLPAAESTRKQAQVRAQTQCRTSSQVISGLFQAG